MMLNFYARWGNFTKAKDCLYAISSDYGTWPRLRIWPKSFSENKFFYPRYVSHVLWGLATYKFYSNTFQNSDSNKNTTFNSTYLYNPASKIIEQDVRILRPFLWGHKQSDREIFSEKSLNYSELLKNPLKLGRNTLWLLKSGHSEKNQAKLLSAKTNLKYILNAKSLINDQARMSWALPKHNDIPDGWWSCMDNAIIALDLQVASEIFRDKINEIMARKVINSMLQAPNYGGSLLWLGENNVGFQNIPGKKLPTKMNILYLMVFCFLFRL